MNTYVQAEFPVAGSGAQVRDAEGSFKLKQGFDSTKLIGVALQAGLVTTLLLVVGRLVASWGESNQLLGWVVLWAVGFAAMVTLTGVARTLSTQLVVRLDAWSRRIARARADERMWALAKTDARIMAELEAARLRAQG